MCWETVKEQYFSLKDMQSLWQNLNKSECMEIGKMGGQQLQIG